MRKTIPQTHNTVSPLGMVSVKIQWPVLKLPVGALRLLPCPMHEFWPMATHLFLFRPVIYEGKQFFDK